MGRFAIRGVIEGFYGNPWSGEQRLAIIPRLARYGYNAFVYGPKDDRFIREDWRLPYDEAGLGYLLRLQQVCQGYGMALWYLLAPCFSIQYSDPDEFRALGAKYGQLYGLGVRTFGLLFDDIPETLQHPADRDAYASLVAAHIDLTNRLDDFLKALDPGNALVVCPTEYWGDGRHGYLGALGQGIPDGVAMFYTGETICAHTLDTENAQRFARLTGKKPLYWDNYPVNDANMTQEYHIAPIIGRSSDLWRYADGLVVNPMEYIESSMIPLYTIGEYLTDPEGYDPAAGHRRAIADVLGPDYVEAAQALSDMCYKSALTRHGEQFPEHGPGSSHHDLFLDLVALGRAPALIAWARDTGALLRSLEGCPNGAFVEESCPWRQSALCFCSAVEQDVQAGGVAALLAYLGDPMDVMKYEAERLIERIRTGCLPCAT